ncbi:unnamed protein product [Fraxinus pennsylvanica]|uniref:Uncharacterized protein n=1 Tax=Fraxinus pennsylvanica TaxID=56036 RepID=A0AAD2DIP7_9LAMI|nr:unnamed protein product [Fraxinus pennsylvanica]
MSCYLTPSPPIAPLLSTPPPPPNHHQNLSYQVQNQLHLHHHKCTHRYHHPKLVDHRKAHCRDNPAMKQNKPTTMELSMGCRMVVVLQGSLYYPVEGLRTMHKRDLEHGHVLSSSSTLVEHLAFGSNQTTTYVLSLPWCQLMFFKSLAEDIVTSASYLDNSTPEYIEGVGWVKRVI